MSLSKADADRLGLKPEPAPFTYRMRTANGETSAAPVRLREVNLGGIALHDILAVIPREGGPPITLLGMSFLGRLSAVETRGGRLTLRQ